MRVIAGTSKGRKLFPPKNNDIRPTPDKVKGAFFNAIGEAIIDASFLDLCAGSGAMGIEAVSRGALRVHFVEKEKSAGELLKKNLMLCGFLKNKSAAVDITHRDAIETINWLFNKGTRYDYIFLDPPYNTDIPDQIISLLGSAPILEANGVVIVEHFFKKDLPEKSGVLTLFKKKRYGDTVLSYYSAKDG